MVETEKEGEDTLHMNFKMEPPATQTSLSQTGNQQDLKPRVAGLDDTQQKLNAPGFKTTLTPGATHATIMDPPPGKPDVQDQQLRQDYTTKETVHPDDRKYKQMPSRDDLHPNLAQKDKGHR